MEGAVRYLVKDRMSVTGARWSVKSAEAVLELSALGHNFDHVSGQAQAAAW